jgi:hypothetical protein
LERVHVEFEKLPDGEKLIPPPYKAKFLSITDVVRWRVVKDDGTAAYSGLVITGPKPSPGGSFQMEAEFTIDIPDGLGIPINAIQQIGQLVMGEFQRQVVIKTYDPPTTKN